MQILEGIDSRMKCTLLCSRDPRCGAALHSEKSNECRFISYKLMAIRINSTGENLLQNIDSLDVVKHYPPFIDNPIVDTIPLDSTSHNLFPQHFVLGCNYTIAFWMWNWKDKKVLDERKVLFSTRPMDLSLGKSKGLEQGISNRALHPTVFHNIRGRNDIFSSPGMNEDGSMYEGCWPGFQVPYHEWYHFAVTFN